MFSSCVRWGGEEATGWQVAQRMPGMACRVLRHSWQVTTVVHWPPHSPSLPLPIFCKQDNVNCPLVAVHLVQNESMMKV